jgi:hypothetical protein
VAFAFDTLGYAKRLREAGVQPHIAEAQAEAGRDFIMVELATKTDLLDIKHELQVSMDSLALRLTLGLGTIIVPGIAVLAALQKL